MKPSTLIIIIVIALSLACGSPKSTPSTSKPAAEAPKEAATTEVSKPSAESPTEVAATEAPTTIPESPTEVPAQAYKIGDNVKVGEVRWLITEVKDEGQTLKSDNQLIEPKTTAGKFLRVSFEVENLGKDPKSFTGLNVKDNQGRTFQNYSEGLFFIDQSVQCIIKPLNPGVPIKCQSLYELPANAAGLVANPGDLNMFGGEESMIALQ